jgi:peptide/nickel transport system ATP-binding protein
MTDNVLLDIKDLKTYFFLQEGTVKAVDGADLTVRRGKTLGVVGESGCGKSVTAFSILQIVEDPGRIVGGKILYHATGDGGSQQPAEVDLAALNPRGPEIRKIRGGEIAMIFQEPMTSLSSMHTIGSQIIEAIRLHLPLTEKEARQRAIVMLQKVGIPNAAQRVDDYQFQMSGGMRQRVMIAMALSCNPNMLIADEPTTALDVTTQAQILELMQGLQQEMGMAIMLITHNLGVVAETCDEVVVMYLGEVVERAPVDALFYDPLHPYTRALLASIPKLSHTTQGRLSPIRGAVPDPYNRPTGCMFHPRCRMCRRDVCDGEHPPLRELPDGRAVRCFFSPEKA